MSKLTKAQRSALEWGGGRITYDTRESRAWTTAENGMTKKVQIGTFNSLCLMGAIDTPHQMPGRRMYTLTDAGREALREQS
jgi:hypothetical protein